jgi:hypothetical protein
MNEDLEGALKAYILRLERGAYFEAHEILEEAWHPLRLRKDPLANLLKGLINGAIALEHLKRQTPMAFSKAEKVMCAYRRYRSLCREGIVYEALFREACCRIEALINQVQLKY